MRRSKASRRAGARRTRASRRAGARRSRSRYGGQDWCGAMPCETAGNPNPPPSNTWRFRG